MSEEYDVIVIGGGITGVGIARDLVMRGVSVALFERDDFASGTTGTCMGMLHGGARYIAYDPGITEESCLESGYIQRIAPHLKFRIPFMTVVTPRDRHGLSLMDSYFTEYDKYQSLKNGKLHTRLTLDEALKVEPGLSRDVLGAVVFDEWGVDVFRLNLLNALDASLKGALVENHTPVTEMIVKGDRVEGVRVAGERGSREIYAKFVVNATGPWVPQVTGMVGIDYPMRPSKGTHILLDRRITTMGVTVEAGDGRQVELLPHENTTMVGTTDEDYFGNPDEVRCNDQDVEYLLSAMERALPSIRQARILRGMAGVRPLLFDWGKPTEKITRDFEIMDHEKRDGLGGFITIAGGKMVIYRLMAEKLSDVVCGKLGISEPCRTQKEPLPGGENSPGVEEYEEVLSSHAAQRMVHRHGGRVKEIVGDIKKDPSKGSFICHCEPVMEAEVRYSVREEMARTLDDVRRRVRLGMGPCQGTVCTLKGAVVLGDEMKLSAPQVHLQAIRFLRERWKGKKVALRGDQAAQEELNQYYHLGIYNYHILEDTLCEEGKG